MKKTISVFLTAVLLVCAFSSCEKAPVSSPDPEGSSPSESVFTLDNEIITYQKIDPEKIQLVVSRTGNFAVEQFCQKFEELNPDIQIIYLDITGGNQSYTPFSDWIIKGFSPDITFSSSNFFSALPVEEYFVDLSANPIIQKYETEALQRTATNGFAYVLPGPSNVFAMMYNKTLFAEYGWEVPKTFDEFVALCDRITEDTEGTVEPWNPNAKYSSELLTALEAITYGELFGGIENRIWYNDFTSGNASFSGHMEPYFDVIKTLADHNILREDHFSYSATTRGKEFAAGKIAMINGNIYDADNDEFDFGVMPLPTSSGEIGYISDSYSCFVAVPKKEHTEAELDAIRRFLEFFSSEEGQNVYIGNTMKISTIKGLKINNSEDLGALQPVVDEGHLFAPLEFSSTIGKVCNFSLHQSAFEITAGTKTPAECIAEADAMPYVDRESIPEEKPAAVASAPKDLTILETSFYIADMYREKAGADIGLISNNEVYRGNVMKIFGGDITSGMITVFKPRSFENDSTLVKLSMTGSQILGALNNPVGNDRVSDSIYAFSGLRCEVSPWNKLGEKYLSVTLSDGTPLEADTLYTVAAWAGTVSDEYITETLETYEGGWEELMEAKMTADKVINPASDGRITLVWDSSEE